MSKRERVARLLRHSGGIHALDWFWGKQRLTVLAYHRINDYPSPDFLGYAPIVSASPQMFERQMEFVAQHYNVIELEALQRYVLEGIPLPPKPLLITFDDGYLDNYQHAFPILRQYGLPAVLFLVSDCMDAPATPLWWDACALYFRNTQKTSASLPLLGDREFGSAHERQAVLDELIARLKTLPEPDKQQALQQTAVALDVSRNTDYPPFFVTWDQVREMVAGGVACQPHTVTHPILARVTPAEAHRQLAESKARIQAETKQPTFAFAFPNGQPGDYDANSLRSLHELGYTVAFTLAPGPMRASAVRSHPLQMKRVYLGRRDSFEMFLMKIMGIPALFSQAPFEKGY
jgi:peptidoglycan/xylan/chitin deacetylase (PgdA/CDA1 family)